MLFKSFGRLTVALLVVFALVVPPANASSIWFGIEDACKVAPSSCDADGNDLIGKIQGKNLQVVSNTPGASWNSMMGFVLNENGIPFFDQPSYDGYQMAVAFYLTGTGGYSGSGLGIPQNNLLYWGVGTSADPSFAFASDGEVGSEVLLKVSAWGSVNQLFYKDSLGEHLLFTGAATPGSEISFVPVGNWSLVLNGPGGKISTIGDGASFPIFTEDVPEPGSAGFAILGGVGLIVLSLRRRQRH